MMDKELSYWLALAHLPKVTTRKKNEIVIKLFEEGRSIADFFHAGASLWSSEYNLSDTETAIFQEASEALSNYAFMVEDLLEQGYHILPISSKDYSPELKKNLGRSYAPPVMYAKGNLQIMKERSIAIVGSRKASEKALEFTDKVAGKASKDYKVVVSGFAKGVDKQALDSALTYKGQSIIVLPQGIATFGSGFKKYYRQIVEGDVLVVSVFHPKAPWSVPLAMARNPIIYGMASEIYVAESGEKGGTWSGVMDGLRKKRSIYIRRPGPGENNANAALIAKGGKAVDRNGDPIAYNIEEETPLLVFEPGRDSTETQIIELLKKGAFDSGTIIEKLKLSWSPRKLNSYLKDNENITIIKGKPLKFTHKLRISNSQITLF